MESVNNNVVDVQKGMIWLAVAVVTLAALICQLSNGEKKRLSKKYRSIYRVVSLSSDNQCILKAEGASIEIGDYGWEAEPIYKDNLIYLHGLNNTWQVVWYAGFRPDQIEIVGPKPKSQYYVYPEWMNSSKKISPCPFPVKKFNPLKEYLRTHLGFPQKIHGTWVQGKRIDQLSNS